MRRMWRTRSPVMKTTKAVSRKQHIGHSATRADTRTHHRPQSKYTGLHWTSFAWSGVAQKLKQSRLRPAPQRPADPHLVHRHPAGARAAAGPLAYVVEQAGDAKQPGRARGQ